MLYDCTDGGWSIGMMKKLGKHTASLYTDECLIRGSFGSMSGSPARMMVDCF